ncbi:MAG: hypothetical protein QOJ48_2293 [Frankiales bacterium]|nr:hypothetical protein [Frankiales bacterium]
MAGKYEFAFDELSVYAKVRDVLVATTTSGTVVDLGCGHGALAEICRAHGLGYLGADRDHDGLVSLAARGFPTSEVDLTDLGAVVALLDRVAADGPVGAVLLLDTLEHLPEPWTLLKLLSDQAARWGSPRLVVSIPNITHRDVGAKLVAGRWDVTPTGLLDSTHLQMFSAARVDQMTRDTGWAEVARADFPLAHSDQRFPEELPTLSEGSPLAELLRLVRPGDAAAAIVNQFVRAYEPVAPATAEDASPGPFLSVLVRTTGKRWESLRDLLLCLSAQRDEDLEVLVLGHGLDAAQRQELAALGAEQVPRFQKRVRVVDVPSGGGRARPLNVGVQHARGRYISVVDDDDVVTADYVGAFHRLADTSPGQLLRAVTVTQTIAESDWTGTPGWAATSPFVYSYPPVYSAVEHLRDNFTPFCALAFPAILFHELGHRFDEDLPVLEDWEMQLRGAQLCGVASTREITSVYHVWEVGMGSASKMLHAAEEWAEARGQVRYRFDSRPLLLPAGSLRDLDEAHQKIEELWVEISRRGEEMERLHGRLVEEKAFADRVRRLAAYRALAKARALHRRWLGHR